ncbi:MAG: metalloregulator ArsR/SmtB family transcription factor [Cyanobacteriota bacterium]|nr:metalloregulator ArsR/SmtB family transcription factor [Cyanobacteriota bacterium]
MVKISTTTPSASIMAANFHALSDSLRISILELLQHEELCVCELCDRLEVSQSKLSFHLKILKDVSLVRSRQEGRWSYYSLNLSQFATLQEYLAEFQLLSPRQPGRPCPDFS